MNTFHQKVSKCLSKVTFELKAEEYEGNLVKTLGTSIPGSRKSRCGQEAAAALCFSRSLGKGVGKWRDGTTGQDHVWQCRPW